MDLREREREREREYTRTYAQSVVHVFDEYTICIIHVQNVLEVFVDACISRLCCLCHDQIRYVPLRYNLYACDFFFLPPSPSPMYSNYVVTGK